MGTVPRSVVVLPQTSANLCVLSVVMCAQQDHPASIMSVCLHPAHALRQGRLLSTTHLGSLRPFLQACVGSESAVLLSGALVPKSCLSRTAQLGGQLACAGAGVAFSGLVCVGRGSAGVHACSLGSVLLL
jgi:hypothetical protein